MTTTLLPRVEAAIKQYQIGRAHAHRLRQQADLFWRMGFGADELTLLSYSDHAPANMEVVPSLILKGGKDASG